MAFWVGMALFFILLAFMKMKEETFRRYSHGSSRDKISEDLYESMGITYSATQEQIKKQYKIKATELHPDKNPDCADCKEKFELLAKAYEILGNEDSRKFYDTTSTAMTVIKSSTINLNSSNYKSLVEDSNDIWIIMIYIDDSTCESFTNFWDEVSKQFPYIKFGRVNYTLQPDLLPKLPFRAEEYPFVFSLIKGKVPEFLEFNMEKPSPYELRKFVSNTLDKKYSELEYTQLHKYLKDPRGPKASIVCVVRTRVSSSFTYLAHKTSNEIDYYSTKLSDHSKIIKHLGVNNANYIVKFPDYLSYADKDYITMDFESNEAAHMSLNPLAKFMAIPQIQRYGFHDYCSDYIQNRGIGQVPNPTICILALKSKDKDYHMTLINYFKQKQSELLSKYVIAARKQETNVFDRIKAIQFATVQLDDNKLLKNLVGTLGTTNPKALVFNNVDNKIVALNNIDDLMDMVDDIIDGSATNVTFLI